MITRKQYVVEHYLTFSLQAINRKYDKKPSEIIIVNNVQKELLRIKCHMNVNSKSLFISN